MSIKQLANLDDATARLLSETAGMLLCAGRDVHVYHLLSADHAEHVVLGEVYELCISAADRISEESLGSDCVLHVDALQATTYVNNALAPYDYLTQMLLRLRGTLSAVGPDVPISNTIADLIGQFTQKRFLLKLTAT